MRETLRTLTELQIENEAALRKAGRRSYPEMNRLGAFIFAAGGHHADAARIKACTKLLKKKVGITSVFRSIIEPVVVARMAMATDAEAYFDEIEVVYDHLRQGTRLSYQTQLISAIAICDTCPPERRDQAVRATLRAYEDARASRAFPIGTAELPIVCLTVLCGRNAGRLPEHAKECYELARTPFKDLTQMVGYLLTLSDKGAREKVGIFWGLDVATRSAGCDMANHDWISILSAYVDLTTPRSELVEEIAEVDGVLRGAKGYGTFGASPYFRRMMAAALVLEDHVCDLELARPSAAALAEPTARQVIETIVTTIVTVNVLNSRSESSSS